MAFAVARVLNVALALVPENDISTANMNITLSPADFRGTRARDAVASLRFLFSLSPPNKIDIVLQKSGVAVARGRVDVAGLLGDTSRPVTAKAVRIAEMLSDLDSLLGIETFMPDAVSQEDTDTLTWAWTLAKGEGIEASWTEGRAVVEDPEVLIASVNRGDVFRIDQLERFRFAGCEYPLGMVSRLMYGATISEARQLESGVEIVLHTTDGRAEERLIRPDPMIGWIGDDSPG